MSKAAARGDTENSLGRPLFERLFEPPGGTLAFSINGRVVHGRRGDTVMTAMLTQTNHVRRFEFADAGRAGFCLIGACQDCWVTCTNGTRIRSCSTLLSEGMELVI